MVQSSPSQPKQDQQPSAVFHAGLYMTYMAWIGGNTTSLLILYGMNETLSSEFLSRDLARLILVILPILTGVIVSVLIVYGEHASDASGEQSHRPFWI